jgi:hypothetical protein
MRFSDQVVERVPFRRYVERLLRHSARTAWGPTRRRQPTVEPYSGGPARRARGGRRNETLAEADLARWGSFVQSERRHRSGGARRGDAWADASPADWTRLGSVSSLTRRASGPGRPHRRLPGSSPMLVSRPERIGAVLRRTRAAGTGSAAPAYSWSRPRWTACAAADPWVGGARCGDRAPGLVGGLRSVFSWRAGRLEARPPTRVASLGVRARCRPRTRSGPSECSGLRQADGEIEKPTGRIEYAGTRPLEPGGGATL